MTAYFFDASSLAKCHIMENGTTWTRTLLDPGAANSLYAAGITEVEVTSAIVRRHRAGNLSAGEATAALATLRRDLKNEFQIVAVTVPLVSAAAALVEKYALRAYDAIQLAGVMEVNDSRVAMASPPATLVSADLELNAAARSEGILVEGPNNYP